MPLGVGEMTDMQDAHILDCAGLRRDIEEILSGITSHPYENPESFLPQAALCADQLPLWIRKTLYEFRLHGNQEGILLLKGLPCDAHLPATPRAGYPSHKATFQSERLLAMVGSRFGELFGYAQEKNGALFQDVTPSPTKAREQSSSGSTVVLKLHTEKHFHPFAPSYLLLYCLRSDRAAVTHYASVRRLRQYLSAEQHNILFQPLFRSGIDYSFGNLNTDKANGPVVPVFYGSRSDPYICYDLDLMEGTTPEAREALASVRRAAEHALAGVTLDSGHLLILDNRRVAHGRGTYTPRYDGHDRWLQRVYVAADLNLSAEDRSPGSRIVRTRFDI